MEKGDPEKLGDPNNIDQEPDETFSPNTWIRENPNEAQWIKDHPSLWETHFKTGLSPVKTEKLFAALGIPLPVRTPEPQQPADEELDVPEYLKQGRLLSSPERAPATLEELLALKVGELATRSLLENINIADLIKEIHPGATERPLEIKNRDELRGDWRKPIKAGPKNGQREYTIVEFPGIAG